MLELKLINVSKRDHSCRFHCRRKRWLVARPVLRSCNQSALIVDRTTCTSCETAPIGKTNRVVSKPVVRFVCHNRTRFVDGTTLHDWSHGHVRPVCGLFEIAGLAFWTWPPTLLRPNLRVRSPTTFEINRMICQRFICDLSDFVIVHRL